MRRHERGRRVLRRAVRVLTLAAGLAGGLVLALLLAGVLATWFITLRIEARYPPAGHRVPVEGGHLAVLEAGPGEGAPSRGTVVLLHGASANAMDPMQAIGRRLAGDGFRVLAFDRPGFGWSDRIAPDAASPAVQARLVSEALAALHVGPALVVGHSWSGALATAMALDHPERVSGLALLAPVSHPWPGGAVPGYAGWYRSRPGRLLLWIATRTIAAPLGLYYLDRFAEVVFRPQGLPAGYVDGARVPLVLRPGTFSANLRDLDGLYAFLAGQSARYREIAVPTVIVAGDADPVVRTPVHAEALARAVPGARLVVLPGIGHMLHYTATDAVVGEIEGLAARQRAAAE
ncbi:2-hydroxy-6-oxononadienedioate/2-hydroxy-6-oxononatrienedioate hydrolase [Methylobacterium crusticola]|uniref:2-hydroxy-6-oxononadienedioate/2-hydroxy-6-oxononatrienedioate hydrolase n=1 Tax=Methylobacterium crusticola TaxID=1697972 RepID=A0ABQ4QZY7_9HYPH|nr:alpha/beta hydrolase [Methylobacterium crusticola]GJD50893.1 2-hydroxy-6-oxononadienedioate/2-hydroxy-6-oxononatrienedioate hydrolase [Methylobacterium crusticola]